MIKYTKKPIFLVLFFSILSGLNAWTNFSIKNDTEDKIEIGPLGGPSIIVKSGKILNIINYDSSQDPKMNFEKKIVLGKNENEVKIGETVSTDPKRTSYLIAPVIVINKDASNIRLNASTIFRNATRNIALPTGYKYKKYALGGLIMSDKTKPTTKSRFTKFMTEKW